jgi:hypothetical protein
MTFCNSFVEQIHLTILRQILNQCKIQHLGTERGKMESLSEDSLLIIVSLNMSPCLQVDKILANVSKESTVLNFRIDEDGGSMFYRSFGNCLLDCLTSHSRRD